MYTDLMTALKEIQRKADGAGCPTLTIPLSSVLYVSDSQIEEL